MIFYWIKDQETLEKQYLDSDIFDCHMIHMFWLLLSLFLLEVVFIFVPSNIFWSSINKINLKQYWSPRKVYIDNVIARDNVGSAKAFK